MAKQQPPQLQNTSQTDTTIPIKGMIKDPNSSLVSKENWTHAINAINNSDDGDVGTLGNEQANKKCGNAPFTIIGAIHLYKDKWVLFSTNNEQSEIGTWDDSQCKYEKVLNDYVCFNPCNESENAPTPCLNFKTQHLITGAAKENFDCSWQVYWDDGFNPSRTLNLDNIPYIQEQVTGPPVDQDDCITFRDTECIDCEKLRLAPLVKIPCIELKKSPDGGQLRNGSYQAFIAYAINDQIIGDYYGISNIQPLFDHEDLLSGLEINLSNLDTQFEFFQLVIVSNNQNEMQAKEIGFYSTHQTDISIDYINQSLKTVPLGTIPLSTPAYERSDHMYVVNDYLIRSGPYQQYDFNYQPLANEIHTHWTSVKFPVDYYKKGGNKPTFMRDEVYAFFIRFIYNTGEKSASYHIPGRDTSVNINTFSNPENPYSYTIPGDSSPFTDETVTLPGDNDLATLKWEEDGSFGTPPPGDMLFEQFNTAPNATNNQWNLQQSSADYFVTDDGGESIAEGHMAYWQSTERYPMDPVRWNGVSGNPMHDLCGKYIRHHKFPDETFDGSGPGGFLDRADSTAEHIHVLGVNFWNIKWPRFSINSEGDVVDPNEGRPLGPLIPNIVGYEILVGSREGNKSIIAKGIARNMRRYFIPDDKLGKVDESGDPISKVEEAGELAAYIPNYPFNSAQKDPYLSGASGGFTYGNITSISEGDNNWEPYDNTMTSRRVLTIHSPELSFNKPFLSPYEIRTYGMTTGSSIGRFIKSEDHPQQKLLRNISMWVALIVGIGYGIQEVRGRKKKKITPPKALSIGLDSKQDERTGGSETNTLTAGTLIPGVTPGPTVSGTSGTSGNIDTSQGGGAAEAAAPAIGNTSGILLTNGNQTMMTQYQLDQIGTEVADDTALTTASMAGSAKLPMLAYENSRFGVYNNMTSLPQTNRGYIGAGEEIQFEGSRYESAPSATQLLFGLWNFMNFTAEGGQHIIDLIYNLVSYQDYAWKYGGHGLYLRTQTLAFDTVRRKLIDKARYIGPTIQNLSANIRINNLQRPSTVALSAVTNGNYFNLPTQFQDDSRFIIGNIGPNGGHSNPSQWLLAPVGANYVSLKVAFKNQYGQIDGIKQLPTGCWFDWPSTHQQFAEDASGNEYQVALEDATYEGNSELTFIYEDRPYTVNHDTRFYTPTIFGGDTYINRYTEKVIMPFFWDFLKGQPDGFPYDYRLRANVPRPIYWMNTNKYDLSELVRYVIGFGWIGGLGGGGAAGVLPNQAFFLDRSGSDLGQDAAGASPAAGGTPSSAGDDIENDSGGRSLFHIKQGYMYTHCNGIQDFFVESTLNMGLRDYEDTDAKRHYDFVEYTDTERMFHADIIREDNFYKYDASLSRTRFNTQLISWGYIQPRDYDPIVAAECFTHYPKRLIYSLQAQKEAKKDFWRVFLPMNYKDFKNRVNVIKPISKSGALVLFPNLAPAMFQGVDQLQTDLGTKLTIGDGGLFSQPMQNIVNADKAHEYGSCESARSVVNTPSGIFYISQAQGKVFQYDGSGIVNIANSGMKQWFNKYLPSVLLNQYPELEDCNGWIDNPVAGVGCQTVYDPNYDIVYFCKKDYEALVPECIDFVPCEGFYYNETRCGDQEQTINCPGGYTYNPNNPPGQECERITEEEANLVTGKGIPLDIVFIMSSSSRTNGQESTIWGNNVGNIQKTVRTILNNLSEHLTSGLIQIGFAHYGSGRNTRMPLFGGQYNSANGNQLDNPDEMFEPISGFYTTGFDNIGNQVPLTSDQDTLETWLGQVSSIDTYGNFIIDASSIYGHAASDIDEKPGHDIAAGYWVGQNLLYGQGSRNCKKIIINLGDSYQRNNGSSSGTYSSNIYTIDNVTGTDIFAPDGVNSMTVDPVTPEMEIGLRLPVDSSDSTERWALNGTAASWVQDNIFDNDQYQGSYNQENYFVMFPPAPEEENYDSLLDSLWRPYLQQFADNGAFYEIESPDTTWDDVNEEFLVDDTVIQTNIEIIANEISDRLIAELQLDEVLSSEPCDPECELMFNEADQPYCRCVSYVSGTISDSTTLLDLDDENYFKNVSWTVSYDPKAKAWISFHDWHPDLTIPSLNHFFTTKDYIDLTEPECPPGFEWNPTGGPEGIGACCQIEQAQYPANIIVEEEIPTRQVQTVACPTDIVFSVDITGSTDEPADMPLDANGDPIAEGGPYTYPYEAKIRGAFQRFVDAFIEVFADDMYGTDGTDGVVQMGLHNWRMFLRLENDGVSGFANRTPDMSGNANQTVSMSNYVGNPTGVPGQYDDMNWGRFFLDSDSGTNFGPAFEQGQMMLSRVDLSTLGDRTDDPNYRRIHVFISDGLPTVYEGADNILFIDCNANCDGTPLDGTGNNNGSDCGGAINEASWQSSGQNASSNSLNYMPFCGQGERFQLNMNSNVPQVEFGFPPNAAQNAGIGSIASTTYALFCPAPLPADINAPCSIQEPFAKMIETSFYRIIANEPEGVWGLDPSLNFGLTIDTCYENIMYAGQTVQFAQDIADAVLCVLPTCSCPDGYVRVTTPESMAPNNYVPTQIGDPLSYCNSPEGSVNNGVCRRLSCDCNEDEISDSIIEGSFFQSGTCDDEIPNSAVDYYAQSIVFPDVMLGTPDYFNPDPLICNYETLCCIPGSFEKGGIWKHNDRCDLFTNYYDIPYGWEVEIVESKGQTVNTVRSVEYQLESYIYNGNLDDNCGDRFHDLDYNFDEAIIHNTEQVSGLLRLDLNPKNNAPLITDYPIIGINDIRILYSKEEQKYRFNQFWDITDDRGEFTNASQSIFLTELNGYIRELNEINLNYNKAAFQHKKFRHYWNKVILRRGVSGNRKMLLKLVNTKINASFR